MVKNEISYDYTLYPLAVLENAANAYRDIATIRIKSFNDHALCKFIKKEISISMVINEFNNFLIELMNSKNDIL
jgi:DUF1009 family protein